MKQKRYGVTTKTLVAMLALVLLIGCGIGGTLAYLTSKTDEVVNTFTVGNIIIDLFEHEYVDGELTNTEVRNGGNTYKIVPGVNLDKDPTVVVKGDSEDCWLFVKVDETNWPTAALADGTKKVSYGIAEGWTQLAGVTGVYYRKVTSNTADQSFYVLKDNEVTVSDELTTEEVNRIGTGANAPKLTFTAYAVQLEGFNDTTKTEGANAALAWAEATK